MPSIRTHTHRRLSWQFIQVVRCKQKLATLSFTSAICSTFKQIMRLVDSSIFSRCHWCNTLFVMLLSILWICFQHTRIYTQHTSIASQSSCKQTNKMKCNFTYGKLCWFSRWTVRYSTGCSTFSARHTAADLNVPNVLILHYSHVFH